MFTQCRAGLVATLMVDHLGIPCIVDFCFFNIITFAFSRMHSFAFNLVNVAQADVYDNPTLTAPVLI